MAMDDGGYVRSTGGERTVEGAHERFRRITDTAFRQFQEEVCRDPERSFWHHAAILRNACEAATLDLQENLTRIKMFGR